MSFEQAQKYLDMFLSDIDPIKDAYQDESFSYFAVRSGGDFVLVQGTLYLNVAEPAVPLGQFESANVRAGHFKLSDADISRDEFIERIKTGRIPILDGELAFPGNPDRNGANYFPFHEIGLPQRHVSVLWIFGAQSADFLAALQPGLDWELRACATPYDGVQELLAEYQPGILQGVNRIDLAALEVVAVDGSSIVEGETATLAVKTATKAAPERVTVGVRVTSQNKVVERRQFAGADFSWRLDDKGMRIGELKFSVPRAAIVQAFANYNGVTQHFYFFGDLTSFQNSRRAAYEAFDPKLETMMDIVAKAQGKGIESRDFEAAMSWLFWMLGFAPGYIGGARRMSDAPDFVVSTPGGNIAIVECTTGMLKEERKLHILHERTELVRNNLGASSTRGVRVLPVMITAKSRSAITPDLEHAERLGVHVIAREDLDQLIPQSLFPQNADQLFEQAEQTVQDAIAKHIKG
jgi:hypothetical protein